jgi:hypothetical protein
VRVRVPAGWGLKDSPGGLVLQGVVGGHPIHLYAGEAHALAVLGRYGFEVLTPPDP